MNDLLSLTLPGDENVITPPPGFIAPTGQGGLGEIIQWVLIILGTIGVIAGLIFLVLGGIKWITSGGDKEKIESARKTILYSILGIILVVLSTVIMQFVGNILGVKILNK
jgi:hypothetical protein